MAIQFYRTGDDPNKIEKTLEALGEPINIHYMDTTDAEAPSYRLNYSPNYFDANYLYDSITGRFYFVEPPIIDNEGALIYKCKEDYLASHKAEILALECVVSRNENLKNGYLIDGNYKAEAYEEIVTKKFPNEMRDDTVILMTIG